MRETAEAHDEVAVGAGMEGVVVADRREEFDGAILIGEIFRVVERHVGEGADVFGQGLVVAGGEHCLCCFERACVCGEGARRVAEGIARILVEQEDFGERAFGRCTPVQEFSVRGLVVKPGEAIAEGGIEP